MTVVAGLLGSCATAPTSREDKAAFVGRRPRRGGGRCVKRTRRWAHWSSAAMAMPCFPMWGRQASAWAGPMAGDRVYERGQHIGYSDLTQGTVGVQVGARL